MNLISSNIHAHLEFYFYVNVRKAVMLKLSLVRTFCCVVAMSCACKFKIYCNQISELSFSLVFAT